MDDWLRNSFIRILVGTNLLNLNFTQMINKAILLGNVGNDPEIRQTKDGKEIASFTLATSESWKDKSGERKDKTEWHRIVVFSQGLVGLVKNYVKKGSKLYLEGSIATRKWTDNNGVEKYATEIVLNQFSSTIQLLSSNKTEISQHSVDKGNGYVSQDLDSDEIPF